MVTKKNSESRCTQSGDAPTDGVAVTTAFRARIEFDELGGEIRYTPL